MVASLASPRMRPKGSSSATRPLSRSSPRLRESRLPLLHDEGLPFPLGITRARFVAGARAALLRLPGGWTPGGERSTDTSSLPDLGTIAGV